MMADDVMRGPQMDAGIARDMQDECEQRAMELIAAHVKQFRGNHARAELVGLYIVARAYVIHNKLDNGADIEAFDERAAEMARSFKKP